MSAHPDWKREPKMPPKEFALLATSAVMTILLFVVVHIIIAVSDKNNQTGIEEVAEVVETVETEEYTAPDPCTLDSVVCEDEKDALIRPVSAYTSRVEETDASPCISASGANICALHEEGEAICASNDYPFGTVLYVEGFGGCTVYDRMASRKDGWVDVYMGYNLDSALNWGVRNVKVIEL